MCRSSVGHHEVRHQGISKGEADVNLEYNYLQKEYPRYDQGMLSTMQFNHHEDKQRKCKSWLLASEFHSLIN